MAGGRVEFGHSGSRWPAAGLAVGLNLVNGGGLSLVTAGLDGLSLGLDGRRLG